MVNDKIFTSGGFDGTGFGLFIVKMLAQNLKGSVGVHSEGKNKGSVFWFTVLCKKAETLKNPFRIQLNPCENEKESLNWDSFTTDNHNQSRCNFENSVEINLEDIKIDGVNLSFIDKRQEDSRLIQINPDNNSSQENSHNTEKDLDNDNGCIFEEFKVA
jgi:hypothetical protein